MTGTGCARDLLLPARLAFSACALALLGACATALPAKRPPDLTIKITRIGGGAAEGKPVGDELVVSGAGDSHFKVEYAGGGAVSYDLDVRDSDMDALYEVLRQNGFGQLSAENGATAVKSGTLVVVKWQEVELAAHASPHMDGKKKERWMNVIAALKGYRRSQMEGMGVSVPATFDPSPFGAALPVQK